MYGHLRFCSYRQGGNGFDDSVSPFLTSVGDLILGTMILLGCTHCLNDAMVFLVDPNCPEFKIAIWLICSFKGQLRNQPSVNLLQEGYIFVYASELVFVVGYIGSKFHLNHHDNKLLYTFQHICKSVDGLMGWPRLCRPKV